MENKFQNIIISQIRKMLILSRISIMESVSLYFQPIIWSMKKISLLTLDSDKLKILQEEVASFELEKQWDKNEYVKPRKKGVVTERVNRAMKKTIERAKKSVSKTEANKQSKEDSFVEIIRELYKVKYG